jgi:hypothetical protein
MGRRHPLCAAALPGLASLLKGIIAAIEAVTGCGPCRKGQIDHPVESDGRDHDHWLRQSRASVAGYERWQRETGQPTITVAFSERF